MTARTNSYPHDARLIRGAKHAFKYLDVDEEISEWMETLTDCIDYMDAKSGSLEDLRACGFAAILMKLFEIPESAVVSKMESLMRTFENLVTGTAKENDVVDLGKFFDAWADTIS